MASESFDTLITNGHDMPNGDWRRQGRSGGYRYILVNGEVTQERSESNGATPGAVTGISGATVGAAT